MVERDMKRKVMTKKIGRKKSRKKGFWLGK